MQLDMARIDEKIRKLQDLKRIASDPEMLALLENLVTPEGAAQEPVPVVKPKPTSKPSNGSHKKGDLLQATRSAISAVTGSFTGGLVVRKMEAAGFVFGANSPQIAVNGALRKLIKKGEVAIVKPGKGRAPGEYARLQQKAED